MSRLTCKQLVELVTEYLEETLGAPERERFEAHLSACEGCGAYVDQMRKTILLTGRIREQDVAPDARERLLSAFRDWRARPT